MKIRSHSSDTRRGLYQSFNTNKARWHITIRSLWGLAEFQPVRLRAGIVWVRDERDYNMNRVLGLYVDWEGDPNGPLHEELLVAQRRTQQ